MSTLSAGDVAPRFLLPDANGGTFDLYADDVAGRFVVLVLCAAGVSNAAAQLKRFANAYDSLRRIGMTIIAVCHEPAPVLAEYRQQLGLPFDLLSDPERKVFGLYGVSCDGTDSGAKVVTMLIRPNQHILGILRNGLHDKFVVDLVSEELAAQREVAFGFQPPILMVPDVLSRADCGRLIDIYNAPGAPILEPGKLDNIEVDGDVKIRVPDYDRRDRVDHLIVSDETKTHIAGRVRSRLLREIKKSFNYSVTSFEALRIACYDGQRGGKAHGHRDNSLPDVAHRRFAVSVNLNAEEFEGGEIWFPEFGPRRYRPRTGAALVFSCSLLHEALAVTRGRRYVLLAFLNGNQ